MPFIRPRKHINFWKSKNNQRDFLENYAKTVGLKSLEDWHQIKGADVVLQDKFAWSNQTKAGGTFLNKYYSESVFLALTHLYPNYNWKPWKFSRVPQDYWKQIKNIVSMIHLMSNTQESFPWRRWKRNKHKIFRWLVQCSWKTNPSVCWKFFTWCWWSSFLHYTSCVSRFGLTNHNI